MNPNFTLSKFQIFFAILIPTIITVAVLMYAYSEGL
jgi:hypothetical protein